MKSVRKLILFFASFRGRPDHTEIFCYHKFVRFCVVEKSQGSQPYTAEQEKYPFKGRVQFEI